MHSCALRLMQIRLYRPAGRALMGYRFPVFCGSDSIRASGAASRIGLTALVPRTKAASSKNVRTLHALSRTERTAERMTTPTGCVADRQLVRLSAAKAYSKSDPSSESADAHPSRKCGAATVRLVEPRPARSRISQFNHNRASRESGHTLQIRPWAAPGTNGTNVLAAWACTV